MLNTKYTSCRWKTAERYKNADNIPQLLHASRRRWLANLFLLLLLLTSESINRRDDSHGILYPQTSNFLTSRVGYAVGLGWDWVSVRFGPASEPTLKRPCAALSHLVVRTINNCSPPPKIPFLTSHVGYAIVLLLVGLGLSNLLAWKAQQPRLEGRISHSLNPRRSSPRL